MIGINLMLWGEHLECGTKAGGDVPSATPNAGSARSTPLWSATAGRVRHHPPLPRVVWDKLLVDMLQDTSLFILFVGWKTSFTCRFSLAIHAIDVDFWHPRAMILMKPCPFRRAVSTLHIFEPNIECPKVHTKHPSYRQNANPFQRNLNLWRS